VVLVVLPPVLMLLRAPTVLRGARAPAPMVACMQMPLAALSLVRTAAGCRCCILTAEVQSVTHFDCSDGNMMVCKHMMPLIATVAFVYSQWDENRDFHIMWLQVICR
jgi:hypothetical protein